jgi:hypothetical protein
LAANDGPKAAAKKTLILAADALRVSTAYRLLHRDTGAKLPVVLCFDVEPDARLLEHDAADQWAGLEELFPRVDALRARLAELTGAPASFSWFLRMDPQIAETLGSPVWFAEHYAETLAALESHGDELGVHTHTWRSGSTAATWVRDHDPAWEEHCLEFGLKAFETAFERPCPAHRGGDRTLTSGMLRLLEASGVAVDLTIEPDTLPEGGLQPGEIVTGLSPDWRGVPSAPYRSSQGVFPAPDPASRSDPLLFPLASAPRGSDGLREPLTLYAIPGLFARRVLRMTRTASPPALAFAIRTDRGAIGAWNYIRRNLEHLARLPGVRFATAGAVAAELGESDPA